MKAKRVLYINSDSNARGFLNVEGSHSLQHFVKEVAEDVVDPETKVSVGDATARQARDRRPNDKAPRPKRRSSRKSLPILPRTCRSAAGFGLGLFGLPAASRPAGAQCRLWRGRGPYGGVYHSLYDDYLITAASSIPALSTPATLAKTVGRLVLRAADADLPPQHYSDFAATVADYLDEVKKLADTKRAAAEAQAKALGAGFFALASDPTKPRGKPTPLKSVPHFDFAPLENAVDSLKASAKAYDEAVAAKGTALSSAQRGELFDLARRAEEALAPNGGLPGRPWYRNLIWAPGTLTGYGAKTLPGVREAIEQERWDDVNHYAAVTAAALDAYADALDAGVKLMGS